MRRPKLVRLSEISGMGAASCKSAVGWRLLDAMSGFPVTWSETSDMAGCSWSPTEHWPEEDTAQCTLTVQEVRVNNTAPCFEVPPMDLLGQ